jgi:biopolymer transport protein ExbD
MPRKIPRPWLEEEGINLTPLLDAILNLLFFFILVTTIEETKSFLEVQLPGSSQAAPQTKEQKSLVITVTQANKVYLGGEEVKLDALHERIASLKSDQVKDIIIRGDAKAYNQTIVHVLDECAKAGHYAVSIEVTKEASPP